MEKARADRIITGIQNLRAILNNFEACVKGAPLPAWAPNLSSMTKGMALVAAFLDESVSLESPTEKSRGQAFASGADFDHRVGAKIGRSDA